MKSKNTKALISAVVGSGLDDLNVMFLSFSLPLIISTLGISKVEAGWIATITNLGMLVGGLIFGSLADKYNRLHIFKWTIFIFAVATGLLAWAPNLAFLYLFRFLAGIGVGGEYGIALSIMASLVKPSKMGRMSAINGVAGQIGSILSAMVAGLVVPVFGWRGLFFMGFAPLLLVLYIHFFIDASPFQPSPDVKHYNEKQAPISQLFKTAELRHQTLALMLMTTVQIAGYFGMMNWLPTMMQSLTGVNVQGTSTWMIATILGMCLGMLVFGKIVDSIGPRLAYSIFLILSAIMVYLFTFASTSWQMLVGGAIVGFFVNGMFAGYGAVITRLYPSHISATANNVILNVGRAVGGFSSVIIGWILQHGTPTHVMLFLASLYMISLFAMLSIPNLKQENYQYSLSQKYELA